MTSPSPPLPPGRMGLPIAGETLSFLKNPFGFLEDRRSRYGPVFKSNVFGRRIAFLSGLSGAEAFYDPEKITRTRAHPFPLVDLFGGDNMEMFDGPKHLALKTIALSAFDREALSSYLPEMQRLMDSALSRLARSGPFSAVEELRKLAIAIIGCNVMGVPEGPESDEVTRDYGTLLAGLVSIPVSLPGTPYRRSREARDRLLGRIRRVIRERRAVPTGDALSRMLGAHAPDGTTISDDAAALEVHHIVIAGFIVYAHLAELMRQLAVDPALRERCAGEVRQHTPSGPLTLSALSELRVSTNVVLETKRFVPLVPLAFGRARRDFVCGDYSIPEGWTVYLALSLINHDPGIYADPGRFDPERFGPGRAEHRKHPMAFIPQGAEPPTSHRCLGLEYSTLLCTAFVALLVRGYEWAVPPQDLAYNWRKLPPEPRDGLRVELRARS